MSGQVKPDEAVDWSRVIETNLREQLATAASRATTFAVELDVERQVHDEEEARLQTQIGVVEAERDRARALAVRLEQELAEAERAALADKRWKLAAEAVLGVLTIQGDPALSFIERVVAFGERVSS